MMIASVPGETVGVFGTRIIRQRNSVYCKVIYPTASTATEEPEPPVAPKSTVKVCGIGFLTVFFSCHWTMCIPNKTRGTGCIFWLMFYENLIFICAVLYVSSKL